MSLIESLEALLREHDRIGSPLRDRLAQGNPPGRVEAAIQELGLTPSSELVDLFVWHDIQWTAAGETPITWFWPAYPLGLEDAVDSYKRSMELGGVTPAELQRHLADSGPASTLTGFWRSDWFPILYGGPEEYAVVCSLDGRQLDASPVWRTNWHPDDNFQSAQMAPTLVDFVDRIVELFRAGAYEWNPEQQDITTVDHVFERLGLGGTGRPWP